MIAPLVDAATSGGDLVSAVTTVVNSLGFDTFMYGLTTVYRPGHDSFLHFFTTAPKEWVRRYNQAAYIEIDPRVEAAMASTLPYIWDQSTERHRSTKVDKFLDDAASQGIRSGVSFLLLIATGVGDSLPKLVAADNQYGAARRTNCRVRCNANVRLLFSRTVYAESCGSGSAFCTRRCPAYGA